MIFAVTGVTDLIAGTPNANRSHPETQKIVGYMLNLLPIRSHLSGAMSFKDLVADINRCMQQAFEHQDYPFSCMIDDLVCPTSFNRHPLFDIMMVFHNERPPRFSFDQVQCEPFFEDSVSCRFDLDFEFFASRDFDGFIEYDRELYQPETVAQIAATLANMTRHCCAHPDLSLEELIQQCDLPRGLAEENLRQAVLAPVEEDF
jgi:non-ribosomal peptide synthetase component F